jgi:hypothetical protein
MIVGYARTSTGDLIDSPANTERNSRLRVRVFNKLRPVAFLGDNG